MTTSPIRALLVSHAQAAYNRSIREMGRNGTIAMVVAVISLGLFGLIPITLGMIFAGWSLGHVLHNEWAPAVVGAIYTLLALGGGLMGGVLGGAKSLDWERLRGFPLSRRQIFSAELMAGLGDLLPLLLALGLGSFTLGLIIAQPFRAPVALVLLAGSVLVLLTTQLLVGGLATRLLRHLKTALFVCLGLIWIGSVFAGSLSPHHARKAKLSTAVTTPQPITEARVREIVTVLRKSAEFLPATQSAHGLSDANLLLAGLRQLPLFLLAGLMAWLAATLLWRESFQDAQSLTITAAQAKVWTFSRPAHGIARLQWRTLTGSMIGRFAFLIPILAVVIIKGPLANAGGTQLWAVPGAFMYLSLSGTQLVFNMFGLDQGAVKGILLLPITPKELLLGKCLGYGLFLGLQGVILSLLLALVGAPALAPQMPAGLMLYAACTLAMLCIGLWSSVAMPRPLSRKRLNNSGMPMVMILISMGSSLGCAAVFGGLFAGLAWLAPRWLFLGMLLAAAAMVLVFRAALEVASTYFTRHRERLVERLG